MKKVYIFIFSVFVLFIGYSYQGYQGYFIGKYSGVDSPHRFEFFKDSTFEYIETFMSPGSSIRGTTDKYSRGKWSIAGRNKVVLNSTRRELATIEFNVIPANNEWITINVNLNIPGQNNKAYICRPILDGDIFPYIKVPDMGSYSFSSEVDIDSIRFEIECRAIKVLGMLQPEYYTIYSETKAFPGKHGDNVDVNLTVPDSLFSYRVFTNTALKIKGNTFYFNDSEKGKKYRLQKLGKENEYYCNFP